MLDYRLSRQSAGISRHIGRHAYAVNLLRGLSEGQTKTLTWSCYAWYMGNVTVQVTNVCTSSVTMIYVVGWTTAERNVNITHKITTDDVTIRPEHACPGDVSPPHF